MRSGRESPGLFGAGKTRRQNGASSQPPKRARLPGGAAARDRGVVSGASTDAFESAVARAASVGLIQLFGKPSSPPTARYDNAWVWLGASDRYRNEHKRFQGPLGYRPVIQPKERTMGQLAGATAVQIKRADGSSSMRGKRERRLNAGRYIVPSATDLRTMFPEPRRVDGPRIPLDLFVRRSASDPLLFDVVDDAGNFIAKDVPDLNTARVLATAPRLLDGFYEMRWTLDTWFVHGFEGVGVFRERDEFDEAQQRYANWLEHLANIETNACAPNGRFPI